MTAAWLSRLLGSLAWGRPWAFALLLALPWLVWRGLCRDAARSAAPASLVHPDLHGLLQARARSRRPPPQVLLVAAAWACCTVALAQPQGSGPWVLPPPRGRDVLVLLDTTLSMTLRDLRWNDRPAQRLAVVKQVFAGFVRHSPGDRFGVIAYGARAATLLPPTFDRRLAVTMLMRARPDLLGDGGCLGDAIALALRQVDTRAALRPVLVVYSDNGWSQGGHISPAQATALARALGVRVFTVQVGGRAAAGGSYRVPAFDAPQPDLRSIASLTGGAYFYAADAGAQQRAVAAIARLAPTLQPPPRRRSATPLYAWPLVAAVLLLALARVWPARRLRGRSGR